MKIYADFAAAINRAKAQDEARRVARINQAGEGGLVMNRTITETVDKDGKVTKRVIEEHRTPPDWRADAFHLERAYPETWGRRTRMHLDAEGQIHRVAERVGKNFGMTAEEVLAEGEAYLREEGHRGAW